MNESMHCKGRIPYLNARRFVRARGLRIWRLKIPHLCVCHPRARTHCSLLRTHTHSRNNRHRRRTREAPDWRTRSLHVSKRLLCARFLCAHVTATHTHVARGGPAAAAARRLCARR